MNNSNLKRCKNCGSSKPSLEFTRKNKEWKSCNKCSMRNVKREKKSEKLSISFPDGRDIELVETVNRKKLNFLIHNHKKYDIGKSFVKGKLVEGKAQLTLLTNYLRSLNKRGEVKIKYEQRNNFGRYYGKQTLQLQNLARPIRHTICDGLIDIDIKNAHPTFLSWYCKSKKIPCEGFDYYINNREECLKEICEVAGIKRDDAKKDLLAIINGRKKTDKQVLNYPEWYINYYNNIQEIKEEVMRLEPEFKKLALKKKRHSNQNRKTSKEPYNVDGTTINYVMLNLENIALMAMYDVCKYHKIDVASLNYDGMMIYKNSFDKSTLPSLFEKMEKLIFERIPGCRIKIVEKIMDEGFDIDDLLTEYEEQDLTKFYKGINTESLFRITPSEYITVREIPEEVSFVQDLDWEDFQTLCINAPMGRGKTSSVCRWIMKNEPKRVLVLSPRISYAKSITSEYNEKVSTGDRFVCYKETTKEGIQASPRLVLSMESIHKLDYNTISKNPYDLVVIDECQANLSSHTCTATNKGNFDNNWFHFETILRNAKRTLYCDAFINDKTCNFLTDLEIPTLLLDYKVPMQKRTAKILIEDDYDALLPLIEENISNGMKPYVVMSSALRLEKWVKYLSIKFPDKNFLSYKKGSGKSIKNVRQEWKVCDGVFTTTTITVGINYDIRDDFDTVFMSLSSASANKVVDMIQAHYRVRHLKTNNVIVHIMNRVKDINFEDINEYKINDDLKWFEKNMIREYELFEKAPEYLIKLLCANILEENLSKEVLTSCVYAFFEKCNYDIEEVKYKKKEEITDILDTTDIPEIPFSDTPVITREEYIKLSRKKAVDGFVSDEELTKMEKYKFLEFFSKKDPVHWIQENFKTEFWHMWKNFHKKRMNNIKNEKKIKNGYNIEDLFHKQYNINNIAVMNDTKVLALKKMQEICKDLGINLTQQTGQQIPYEKMEKICNKIRTEEPQLRKIFNITDRRSKKSKNEPLTDRSCIALLSHIFKDFGYTQIKQDRSSRKKVIKDGKRINEKKATYYTVNYLTKDLKDKENSSLEDIGMDVYKAIDIKEKKKRLLTT